MASCCFFVKKSQKQKKRLSEKQKSQDSAVYAEDNVVLVKPSTLTASQNLTPSPPPPSVPVAAPQPPLPPPSPPLPLAPLPFTSTPPESIENVKSDECRDEHTRKALVLATAVAAEAAVVAANAAAEVVRLTTVTCQAGKSKEEVAAIMIQTAYRGYIARGAFRALKGKTRLKSLLQGNYGKRQATAMLRSVQTHSHLQSQMQERRARITENNKARQRLLQQKQHQKEPDKIGEDFDVSTKSKQQIEARLQYKKEAAVRRERALAYAYSHQQTWRNSKKLPHQTLIDPNNPHWGWSWLERWMATRPWEAQTKTVYENNGQASGHRNSTKSNIKQKTGIMKPKTRKAISQGEIQLPTDNNDSEQDKRRLSIAIGTMPPLAKEGDESVSSSSTLGSSLFQKSVAKSRVSVSKASNNNLGSKKKNEEAAIKSTPLGKRRFSATDNPKITRRLSDSGKDIVGRNGGKQSNEGGSR